jgi:hypothetical protein
MSLADVFIALNAILFVVNIGKTAKNILSKVHKQKQ